jgi:hypothetical protein
LYYQPLNIIFFLFINLHLLFSQKDEKIEKLVNEISNKIIYCVDSETESFLSEVDWSRSYKDIFNPKLFIVHFKISYESIKNLSFKEEIFLKANFENNVLKNIECLFAPDLQIKTKVIKCINKIKNEK